MDQDWNKLQSLLARCRAKAREQPLGPRDQDKLKAIIHSTSIPKALGGDCISITDLRNLPEEGFQDKASLFNSIGSALTSPWQLCAVFISLLQKPNGTDRAMVLVPQLVRMFCAVWSGSPKVWAPDRAGRWDDAVAGKSSLRAVLLRQFRDEAVRHSTLEELLCCSSNLWDVLAFLRFPRRC